MKRFILLATTVILTLAGATPTALASEIDQPTVQALNCQHSLGAGTVVSAAYVETPSGVHYGAVQLCRSGSYYWAYIVLYAPEPAGWWALAHLFRYENGVHNGTWSCSSSGGNGHVEPGQTMCWTPRIYGPSASTTFMASGKDCIGTYPTCSQQAYGVTLRTR